MKNLKYVAELLVWVLLCSPMYPLYNKLDYLVKNVWGTRHETRGEQIFTIIYIIFFIFIFTVIIYYNLIYRKKLLSYKNRKADTVMEGGWFLKHLFNKRHRTYIYSGYDYWVGNNKKWYNEKGSDVGRISWIDNEINKQDILDILKNK